MNLSNIILLIIPIIVFQIGCSSSSNGVDSKKELNHPTPSPSFSASNREGLKSEDQNEYSSEEEGDSAPQFSEGGSGLPNLGNTCHTNSAIQLIRSLPHAEAFLKMKLQLGTEDISEEAFLSRQSLQRTLFTVVKAANSGKPTKKFLENFFDSVNKYLIASTGTSEFSGGLFRQDQFDAQEVLGFLLDALEYRRFYSLPTLRDQVKLDSGPLLGMGAGTHENLISIGMQDHNSSSVAVNFQSLFDASLTARLTGENQYFNESSNTKEDATRNQYYHSKEDLTPPATIFQLKRFSSHWQSGNIYLSKNSSLVEIPNPLRMQLFSGPETNQEPPFEKSRMLDSQIRSVIVHEGETLLGGHYMAYVYNQKLDQWTLYDDNAVVVLDTPELRERGILDMQTNGYLFLYVN